MGEKSVLEIKIRDVQDQISRAIWHDISLDNPGLVELNEQLDLLIIEWMRFNIKETTT